MLKKLAAPDIKTEITTVTPQIADAWMSQNKGNRKISRDTVKAYARDMASAKWLLNGDAIRFDTDGTLIDGQHRLLACIESDSNFQTIVVYNLAYESRNTVDANRRRTAADILVMNGHNNGYLRAATLRLMCGIKMDLDYPSRHKATTQEIMAMQDRHPNLAKSFFVHKTGNPMPVSMLATIHYIGHHILKEDIAVSHNFADVFVTGKQCYKDDPALLVRERVMQAKMRKQEIPKAQSWMMMVTAWNKFRKRERWSVINKKFDASAVRIDDLDIRKL
jgi:hypothetical protein